MSNAVLRAFIAIHLPPSARGDAADLIDACRNTLPQDSVRFLKPENLHLTLRFIGNVSVRELGRMKEALRRAVRGTRPFSVRIDQLGGFPQIDSPRVLWLGVRGDVEALKVLQSRALEETSTWGRLEDREFHPHLTLGRVLTKKRAELKRIGEMLRDVETPESDVWSVEEIHLMQSELASGGSKYSTIASYPLAG